jgi:hypothetical protein
MDVLADDSLSECAPHPLQGPGMTPQEPQRAGHMAGQAYTYSL